MRRWENVLFLIIVFGFSLVAGSGDAYAQKRQKKEKQYQKDSSVKSSVGNTEVLIDAKKEAILGNLKGAKEILDRYTERYPLDPVGLYELARLETNEKNFQQALLLVKKANELDTGNIWYTLLLGELYQLTSNYKEAISIYDHLVRRYPENLEYQYQLAALYLTNNRFEDAIKIYDQIELENGITEDIILQKQKIYLHLKESTKAEAELKKLISAFPRDSRYYSMLAEFYMNRNMYDKAFETYQKVIEIDHENAYIHMALADYYRKTGDRSKAIEELKLGFRNPNLDIDSKVTILLSFYTINQLYSDLKEEGFELTRILIATHPNDPKGYSIYGDLLAQDKKFAEARDAFLKVISIDSSKYAVWEELLRLSIQLEDFIGITDYSARAIDLFPDQPVLYLFNGLAYLQLKDPGSSLNALNRGVKLVINNDELLAQFYMYLGDAWHAQKNETESDNAYEKALQLKKDNAYVLNNYAYYLSLRGKELEKAEKIARQAVSLEPGNSSFQDTYGWVLYKIGQYKEAKEWIGKAISDSAGVSGEVLEHYGDVLFQLGESEKAIEYWIKAKNKGETSEFIDRKITEKKLFE